MTTGPHGLDDPDLAELGALLASERARPGCLGLSALDGFLAAVLAGPERVPPEEWLPLVWGEGEPAWADRDEARRVFDAIRARHDQVARQLEENPDAYAPIFRTLHDGMVTAADWARGFLVGVELRPSLWDALTASAEGIHRATYRRLRAEAERCAHASLLAAAERFGLLPHELEEIA